jgi:hypothetical protein
VGRDFNLRPILAVALSALQQAKRPIYWHCK